MPPRKFAVEPIEQTSKTCRAPADTSNNAQKPRKFAPEPVEEIHRSSKDKHGQQCDVDHDAKPKPRRFAPQPVEHTTKSTKETRQTFPTQDDKPKSRRFAPQLVEESEKSSRDKHEPAKTQHVKFKPEPVETTYSSRKKAKHNVDMSSHESEQSKKVTSPPRSFTPVLIDTARRSRRAGDPNAPLPQDYRTEYGYHAHSREHWRRINGYTTPVPGSDVDTEEALDDDEDDELAPPDDSASDRGRRSCNLDGSSTSTASCLVPARQHSFRMPELDTIESSESEPDSVTSPPNASPRVSPIATSGSSYDLFNHATRRRESIDESFQHYLLDIERKKAQQRLEEQALAAFPNADFGYEPPHHYFVAEDDDEDEIEERPVTYDEEEDDYLPQMKMKRRDSTAKGDAAQLEMQRHAEQLQQERNAKKTTKKPSESPWGNSAFKSVAAPPDAELKSMQDRARPPMLGTDIVFPRSSSPEPARFDVTQGSASLRNRMCYLTEAAENERQRSGEAAPLWNAAKPANKALDALKSPATTAESTRAKGLWGGFCVNDAETDHASGSLKPPAGPTGLMTPKEELPNAFELAFSEGRPVGLMTPSTPPLKALNSTKHKKLDPAQLNAVLVSERDFEDLMQREFPDTFITQVYNYLSLGYPSLARDFDEELSKISKIPVGELRRDDEKARTMPRGYIRLGDDFEDVGAGAGVGEVGREDCVRWQALKRYVREWARQEKNMVKSDAVGVNFGATARRGSWAI